MGNEDQITIYYSGIHKPEVLYDQNGSQYIPIYKEVGYQVLSIEKDPKTHGTHVVIRRHPD